MRVIVAVDDRNGMLFHNRRQSQDRALRERILSMTQGKRLWMNAYTRQQFKNISDLQLYESEDFLDRAEKEDYCFVETQSIISYQDKIEELVLCKWNRKYPGDFFFDIDLTDGGWTLVKAEEFPGFSHDKITMEVYRRE